MITREEYNKALDIVEAYHKQVFLDITNNSLRNLSNTPVLEWDKFHKCGTRLKSSLRASVYYNKNFFVETLCWDEFRQIRNAGHATWAEFERIRGY